jgi:hypothetical protein
MTKSKRSWFIAASLGLSIATVVGASAARARGPATVNTAVSLASAIPLPALDRLVTRLAAEARAVHQ